MISATGCFGLLEVILAYLCKRQLWDGLRKLLRPDSKGPGGNVSFFQQRTIYTADNVEFEGQQTASGGLASCRLVKQTAETVSRIEFAR